MKELLKVDRLSAGYGKSVILQEVYMFVDIGEIVGIVGPNGSGKSTLLKSIYGLCSVFDGKIFFSDTDLTALRPDMIAKCGISYVPQSDNVFGDLTVVENLEMGGILLDSGKSVEQAIEEILELFPALKARHNHKAMVLSGGERQMLAIGRALISNPKLLLLDEPAASLSPRVANEIFVKLKELNALGMTIVIVEQNVQRVLSVSHRGYVLVSGRKVLEGDSSMLLSKDLGKVFLGAMATS